ncbi:LysR substrate-binding domain-containing protein [Parasphingorhabdus sp.]|jgi:LysR family hydrogen peroxide-inducible transcriptional activator|uniref:hydrogen peroxide-inducible genes activator n=1 Tax=Parasphingorhabdus sp. TaxID=2709688 RepID=UPI003D2D2AF9
MPTYLPTLKQLQYLVALKEHGHFGHAAQSCFVTQSTLSGGIKELESLLDIVLVERTRRVVRFTELGNKMVEKAHRILREAEELSEIAKSAGKPLVGDIRMSVIPTIAPFLLPKLLSQLRKERPELRLFLREETSRAACESLHHGHVDCVLLAHPFPCGDVESENLFDDELFIAFPKDDPRDPPAQVDPALIDESRLLLLEDGHCLKDHALAVCNRPELTASARMMGTSLHTLVQMVDNGLGLTLLPKMAIDSGILDHTDIIARPITSERSFREIALVWRKNSPRGNEFRLLADIMKQSQNWVISQK